MNCDSFKKAIRELRNDRNLTDSDEAFHLAILEELEIPHIIGSGRIIANGAATPWSPNKWIKDGPKIFQRRVFNIATVPALPDRIQLGTGTGEWVATLTRCEIPLPDASMVTAAPTSVVISTTNVAHSDDTTTVTRNYGTLAGLGAARTVTEMALLNSDGTGDGDAARLGWGRLRLSASKIINNGDTLTANYKVQGTP